MTPIYARIAADLRRKITSGHLSPGQRLPTVADLAERWHVSEAPARQALALLATEGLITTGRGMAATVAESPGLVRVAPHRYRRGADQTTYRQEAETAHVAVDVSHETVEVAAPEDVAERLGIEPGDPVTQTDYLFTFDGRPTSMSRCWEPLDLTRSTEIERPEEGPHAHLGVVGRFAQIGVHVRDVEEAVSFRPADERETATLKLPASLWVVAIAQAFHADERTVEVADIAYRPDVYRTFIYRFPVPAEEVRADPDDWGDDIGPIGGMLRNDLT